MADAGTLGSAASMIERIDDFDVIVREHQARMLRVITAIVGDTGIAEELSQEALIRAYQKRTTFRGECSIGTWLTRIAVNIARDHLRSQRQGFWSRLLRNYDEQGLPLDMSDTRPSPERQLQAKQQVHAVFAAVQRLSDQQRTVFTLRFVEELSLEEIADTMQLQVGTVKAHLFRALANVRQQTASAPPKVREV